jgi:hypothetical protein
MIHYRPPHPSTMHFIISALDDDTLEPLHIDFNPASDVLLIDGEVRDRSGQKALGRVVDCWLTDAQALVATVATDVNGYFKIEHLNNRPHHLIISGEPDREDLVIQNVLPSTP